MAVEASFTPQLFSKEKTERYKEAYLRSKPYRHAVIDGLIDNELLQRARQEILDELRFTEKETDIYKVNQTGDLANLDGLPTEEAKRLQSLLLVRNAIYSDQFRMWLQNVTGCGPLSAKKKDMSINDYTSGCHLLNHDDVISTRRLSYILYLPDPSEAWDASWGGALELYPVEGKHIPSNTPSVVIPPKWNQYTFFAVQPGHSFHSVEEVVHPSKSRLSISGWFHRPQSDEIGYDEADEKREEEERRDHASAESLMSKQFDLPFMPYAESENPPIPGSSISATDKSFLSFFLNPAYLQSKTQSILFEKFGDDSHILLVDFLNKSFASALEKGVQVSDREAGFYWWEHGNRARVTMPDHLLGVDREAGWKISGPPHRQRYLSLAESGASSSLPQSNPALPSTLPENHTDLLKLLQSHLLPSPAFRHFIANISQLIPIGARPFQVRRFRPGLDYTLARSDNGAVLDLTIGMTPDVGKMALKKAGVNGTAPKGLAGKKKAARSKPSNDTISASTAKKLSEAWEMGEVGGWEAYMPPVEEGDDPAVYGSSSKKPATQNGDAKGHREGDENGITSEGDDQEEEEIEMMDEDEDCEDEDEDGVLLNLTPSFNTLSLVLRDEKVMRFVKYLSASAGGSRWDLNAEFEVGAAIPEEEAGS